MKQITSFAFILMLCMIYSCDYDNHMITIINKSSKPIIFYIPNYGEGLTSDFHPYNLPKTINPGNSICLNARTTPSKIYEELYPINVYIFCPDIVEEYGWEKVMDEEMFIVHYVPSADDARRLDRCFSYPPNEDMQNVLMYPPYEEVIENYNRMMEQEE